MFMFCGRYYFPSFVLLCIVCVCVSACVWAMSPDSNKWWWWFDLMMMMTIYGVNYNIAVHAFFYLVLRLHCVTKQQNPPTLKRYSSCSVISQGKVVALDRWGEKWNHLSMTHRLSTNCAKNYCNRTLIVKVIVENVITCFFGTRCIASAANFVEVSFSFSTSRCRMSAVPVHWLLECTNSREQLLHVRTREYIGGVASIFSARALTKQWCHLVSVAEQNG